MRICSCGGNGHRPGCSACRTGRCLLRRPRKAGAVAEVLGVVREEARRRPRQVLSESCRMVIRICRDSGIRRRSPTLNRRWDAAGAAAVLVEGVGLPLADLRAARHGADLLVGGPPGGGAGAAFGGFAGAGNRIVDPADGKIPYKPEARAKQQDILMNHMADEPELHCYESGVPHGLKSNQFGVRILTNPGYFRATFGIHAYRARHPNRRQSAHRPQDQVVPGRSGGALGRRHAGSG